MWTHWTVSRPNSVLFIEVVPNGSWTMTWIKNPQHATQAESKLGQPCAVRPELGFRTAEEVRPVLTGPSAGPRRLLLCLLR